MAKITAWKNWESQSGEYQRKSYHNKGTFLSKLEQHCCSVNIYKAEASPVWVFLKIQNGSGISFFFVWRRGRHIKKLYIFGWMDGKWKIPLAKFQKKNGKRRSLDKFSGGQISSCFFLGVDFSIYWLTIAFPRTTAKLTCKKETFIQIRLKKIALLYVECAFVGMGPLNASPPGNSRAGFVMIQRCNFPSIFHSLTHPGSEFMTLPIRGRVRLSRRLQRKSKI